MPYGIPIRGIGYSLIGIILVLALGTVPVIDAILGVLPFSLRIVVLPLGLAYLLTQWKLDGRSAHVAALAWVRHQAAPARLCGFRAVRQPSGPLSWGPLVAAGGESDPANRRAVVMGPATVVLRYPVDLKASGRTLRAQRLPGPPQWQGKQVSLAKGQRIVIR